MIITVLHIIGALVIGAFCVALCLIGVASPLWVWGLLAWLWPAQFADPPAPVPAPATPAEPSEDGDEESAG